MRLYRALHAKYGAKGSAPFMVGESFSEDTS